MQRIIVTGATSMIGAALIKECIKKGIEVYAVIRASSGKKMRLPESEKLHMVDCSLEELEALPQKITEKCDTFYHIAWGNTGENRNSSTELQSRNIAYTLAAVKAAYALGCRRFIGAGSQAEYGPMDVDKISPDSPVNPTTPYGAAKLASGHLARMFCKELGMECIWPRIFSVYGIYEKETTMVASGLRKMLAGEKTSFTPALQRWDYLFSADAGRAYYLIGEKGKDGAVYCVGSGKAAPLKDYIEIMAELTGAEETGIGARPYPAGAVMNLCADISSLTADTGFVPEYTFREGIRETITWLKTGSTGDTK
ncbi:MAG: NAD(P)-dependent oxidoreductase [Blautia sp.]|uniref:NAD-dependent epimerase/dehydratase family protein n=1 Tax=Blautia sp. TaxID=1955243 RepID=UPI002A76462D|nr:NAD(P)-dependent oxidoreductase [Blautia sp.]MDY3017348.1 NAD(P)-dependent oxidoreductase [Blautia sp.]